LAVNLRTGGSNRGKSGEASPREIISLAFHRTAAACRLNTRHPGSGDIRADRGAAAHKYNNRPHARRQRKKTAAPCRRRDIFAKVPFCQANACDFSAPAMNAAGKRTVHMKNLPLKILFAASLLLPPLAGAAENDSAALAGYDAAVIGACLDTIAPALSQKQTAYRESIHMYELDAEGRAQLMPQLKAQFHPHTVPAPFSESVAPPQAPPDFTRLEVRAAGKRAETFDATPLITSLQLRLQEGWRLPRGIVSAGYTLYAIPPSADTRKHDDLVLLFAPPGYDYRRETALVAVSAMPPASRHATATCVLRWRHKKWHILNYQLSFDSDAPSS